VLLPRADVGDGIAPARSALRASWQAGAAVTHYFGHGGAELWADEGLLTADEVLALDGQIQPTVLFTWGCEAQWFLNLWGPSVNEALVLLPHGGAVASFGPVGITNPLTQKPLYEALYRHLIEDKLPLGVAIQLAKREAMAADPRAQSVVDGFGLLGDPAIQVPFEGAGIP
jgi:hypothetical protein